MKYREMLKAFLIGKRQNGFWRSSKDSFSCTTDEECSEKLIAAAEVVALTTFSRPTTYAQ